ncbi:MULTISPECIES: amidohydrolase family protein [Bacillus]|uniref:amidohydrolase family protein n=1 Tax=Bacillus TaxID=1386 RepID=UPI00047AA5CA|nr:MULTISPECIES: amidohydrolase family protein [Bacillus]QHZ45233.1 amidohydrolase [Bacillus sp. NSP9.1]WFA04973.1 amidohydrolase family protein [Bacillus sp. HSf4]
MFDLHTHFIPDDVLQWLKDNQNAVGAVWEKRSPDQAAFLTVNRKWGFELKELFFKETLYLEAQKKAGVSHSLASPVPQLFLYDLPEEITDELSSVYNNALSIWTKHNSHRLSGLGTIPLNSPLKACQRLGEAMDLGLKGAIIGPGASGRLLSDEVFTPLWEEANRRKAIIFIHPLLSEDPRLRRKMMPNLIGVPWETTVCAADLLLSGVTDRFPNVKILLAHGGGYLPYQIGRLNKGYEKWTDVSASISAAPEEYLPSFWFDSVLWNKESAAYLIKLVGEERIVPGSDFPFDLCEWPPADIGQKGAEALLNVKVKA